jgi:MYXO-CTERM domain-containing protein
VLAPHGVRRGEALAAWRVAGAELRAVADGSVELASSEGVAIWRVTAPRGYARGGTPLAVNLEVNGDTLELRVDGGSDDAVLVDPVWTPTQSMSTVRGDHTAVLLPSGRVLVAGGVNPVKASVELYDPTSNTWAPAAPMANARSSHSATRLADGRVLVAGGYDGKYDGSSTPSVEVYHEPSGQWTPCTPMAQPRQRHAAALLADGRVLVVGGDHGLWPSNPLASAELYDPVHDTWTSAPSMSVARGYPRLTLLPGGSVLVSGSYEPPQVFDPTPLAWESGGAMNFYRGRETATLLPNGRVLVAAGYGPGGFLGSAEEYDPATNLWTLVGPLAVPRDTHTATLLKSGHVVVSGGFSWPLPTSATELYDPVARAWTTAGSMSTARKYHTATMLADGRVLVAGGSDAFATDLATAEVFEVGAHLGAPCSKAADCTSAECVDGVCCDTPCGSGATLDCQACSVAAGAAADGTCQSLTGTACDDGDACTQTDNCKAGTCAGGNPVLCTAKDQCHEPGVCDPMSGLCSNPVKQDGTACDDGDACTQADSCKAGTCAGGNPVLCTAKDQCREPGVCDPMTGLCSKPAKPEGSACDDGNACTLTDSCKAGTCTGGNPVVCTAKDQCHEPGVCDPITGLCSKPAKPDGTACDDGDACTQTDSCKAGTCTGGNPVVCTAKDHCYEPGVCDPMTGLCSGPAKQDGSPCSGGTCFAGVCVRGQDSGPSGAAGGDAGSAEVGGGIAFASGPGGDPAAAGGCGCRTAGRDSHPDAAWLGLVVSALVLSRRRRSNRNPSTIGV